MTYVDPQSDLVKAVLAKKATQLATDGLEQLLDEAEAHGLSRDEASGSSIELSGSCESATNQTGSFSGFARPWKRRLKAATMSNCFANFPKASDAQL
jgi:hypothetical protein